ncbi:MAG: phenylacetic acid degradation bifunctional protein PaaZ [Saprospiraceae bacterium]
MKLQNYVCGRWIEGTGAGTPLYDASTGAQIALAGTEGIDFESMLQYGRKKGGEKLRKMTFQERGQMLKALALHLQSLKEKYYTVSYQTGATRIDSWIDIEGGIGNLFANASLRRKFPDKPYYVEGEPIGLSKGGTFIGHHIMVPKPGVAVHINAFNFPIWGMLEKVAVNWLAGMPAIVKPATVTSFLTEAMVKDIIASGILPEGALQLLCGSSGDLLDHVDSQDVVTFTGSATTGQMLKSRKRIIEESVPFNMEADSLNAIILGDDVTAESPEFDIFLKEVRKEMTVKTGQKCTAIRRIIVPENRIEAVEEGLKKLLGQTTIGDPRTEGVRMGALVGKEQLNDLQGKMKLLSANAETIYGGEESFEIMGANKQNGSFAMPTLYLQKDPFKYQEAHSIEAFGPVSTLMPYKTLEDAIELAKMGKGSLVSSIVTNSHEIAQEYVLNAASHHGRILVLNRDCAKESTGHGSPMPLLVHGGPGRAGGGEEMGGMRGIKHYMQRCAIQGSPDMMTEVTQVYQTGAPYKLEDKHVFRKYFEELNIGDTVITHKRTVTDADIVQFANVSWDHFYAHTDATSLDGTLFTERVAHGYFVLSAAAGLFVDPGKGPVLLNYGLEECRFTKPVYPGMTLGVRLTVKEKIKQEKKEPEDLPKGIVKFLVDVYDELNETVAVATILTMVQCKES